MASNLSISERILILTRAMLRAAEAAQWDQVRMQESQRQLLLKEFHTGAGLTGESSASIAANLEETARINGRLVDMGVQARAELAKVMEEVQRGSKANRAYNGVK